MRDIEVDTRLLESAKNMLIKVPKEFEKAVKMAENRAIESARTEATRQATKTYETKQASIRSSIDLIKGKGMLISRGSPLPLYDFKVNPKTPRTRATMTARVKRGGGGTIDRGFIARMKSGHVGVFERTGELTRTGRERIRELYSPSAAQMVGEDTVMDATTQRAKEVFEERILHEVDRVMSRF